MAWHEDFGPGVYQDPQGNIWEKRGRLGGKWFLNGVEWTPFPKSLRKLPDELVNKLGTNETLLETQIRIERALSLDPKEFRDPEEA